jgi:hypothetical protein
MQWANRTQNWTQTSDLLYSQRSQPNGKEMLTLRVTFGHALLATSPYRDKVTLRFVAWRKNASADKIVYR